MTIHVRRCLLLLTVAAARLFALMPMPTIMKPAAGKLVIDSNFTVATTCSDRRLSAATDRMVEQISRQTGIAAITGKAVDPVRATLHVACVSGAPGFPTLGDDESYQLDVTQEGARIQAPSGAGALHAMATFTQLVGPGPDGFQIAALHIEDRPRFPWRGLMLDSSRHWMPVEVVKRNLDAMALVKLNVFHWHLSDDQGFRAESKHFPKLHELGSDGKYYTQTEIRDIVVYAADRGIRVIPEFDIPAHSTSWVVGYPELASAPGPYTIGRTWGVFEPTLDPSREETFTFLDAFLGEMTQLFPDPYFHIGGDEVNAKQWNASPRIQAFAREHQLKDAHAIQAYFNQRLLKILQKYNKIMIGWDEILHPELPTASVIQSWRGPASLADAASKGYRGILSSGYYLDHARPASYHYAVDPLAGPAAQLTAEQSARILGGEACMWAEYVNAETVDSRIWPRVATVAERLWSRKEVIDVNSMYTRMEALSRTLEWIGVRHRAARGPMLDRLTGGRPSEPVRNLADASEALGLGPRARAMKYTSLIPLNRFVDAIPPESEVVRELELAAGRVASKAASRTDSALLRAQFTRWAANDAAFQTLAENDFLLAELRPVSKDLSALAAAALRMLDYLESGRPAPRQWIADQRAELARKEKPMAEVSLAAVRPVKILLEELARR